MNPLPKKKDELDILIDALNDCYRRDIYEIRELPF